MKSNEIRSRFLEFFKSKGHAIIPSASLVPENDPSVLFNTAGMQPLVPYLLGEKHPAGTRLANIQKCVRTGDIDEIGDNTHATFFEMMGNWSLGDYFKKEAIEWSYELLTNTEHGFGLNPQRLYVTCFEGDENAPKDTESADIWKNIFDTHGVTGERIYFMPAKNNWWSPGDNGPCGPDTEMFYDVTGTLNLGMTKEQYLQADDEQKVVEIWNDVFMQYEKKDGRVVGKLARHNVDTGSGFERVAMVLQGKNNIFDTDIFAPIMDKITEMYEFQDVRIKRIVADHVRTGVFMIADGVVPSNTDKGYVLRRLLRRAIFQVYKFSKSQFPLHILTDVVVEGYSQYYPELEQHRQKIHTIFEEEEGKFKKTIEQGEKEFEKISAQNISGKDAFILFSTFGFPFELTKELAQSKGLLVDESEFKEEFKKHQELSRAGAEQKFKGGMGGSGEQELKYHTATHLLHQALRDVLGPSVGQKGSNITAERLRFDFTYGDKMTDEQKKRVEEIINQKIAEDLPMQKVVMKKEDAEKTGALHFFGDKYGDEVSIYFIGNSLDDAYSKEFCGGPHVEHTGMLGKFSIVKEESVSAGVRRIKAVLE